MDIQSSHRARRLRANPTLDRRERRAPTRPGLSLPTPRAAWPGLRSRSTQRRERSSAFSDVFPRRVELDSLDRSSPGEGLTPAQAPRWRHIQNRIPSRLSFSTMRTACLVVRPPLTQSDPEMRIPNGLPDGHALRTSSKSSSGYRIRFSKVPPYSSTRVFVSSARN